MKLTYKKGDIFIRVVETNGKFFTTTYKTEDNLHENETRTRTIINVPLTMIATDHTHNGCIGARFNIPMSANFTDDGIEIPNTNAICDSENDLFVIGNNPQIINKTKAILIAKHNQPFSYHCVQYKFPFF